MIGQVGRRLAVVSGVVLGEIVPDFVSDAQAGGSDRSDGLNRCGQVFPVGGEQGAHLIERRFHHQVDASAKKSPEVLDAEIEPAAQSDPGRQPEASVDRHMEAGIPRRFFR